MHQMNDGFSRGDAAQVGPRIEALLAEGQHVMLQVSGDSMRPTLKPRRDAVVLEPLQAWPPKKYDILLYRSERSQSGYALHRVRRVKDAGPVMNGDAQTWMEGPIARDQVLAKVIMLLRKDEPYDIDKFSYRLYLRLWSLTRPIRRQLFALWRGIQRIIG